MARSSPLLICIPMIIDHSLNILNSDDPMVQIQLPIVLDSSGELLQISVSSVLSDVWDKGNKYSWTGEILKRKGKEVVGNDPELRKELIQHFHDEAIGGHSGAHVTMKKLGSLFYWKCLKKMVKQMIIDCDVCQRQKPDLSAYPGLIQSLPIPERIWKDISMDFIKKLPTSHRKSVILVLHGLPESIVSDIDKVFLSNFWKALFAELKLQPHRQVSIRQGQQHKLLPKYYGPLKVVEIIGEVAYRLELPSSTQIHPVFHISQLKKCHGKDHKRRLRKVNNKPVMFVLIQLTNESVEEATWEIYGDLITRFPGFDAVNEVVP
ncbi:putative mitochondrial protein [Tanacetum coccineum]|uniref:Mitochondrial protein n=1 Tax=Tanacetum coccineum TaxID=301880 RepID=A0ABQ5HIB7_9ASTR